MDTWSACLVLLLWLVHVVEATPQMAQDCRVYHLLNGTEQHRTPAVAFPGHLQVAMWVGHLGKAPTSLAIHLLHSTYNQSVQVFINRESEAILRVQEQQVGRAMALEASGPHTWLALVLAHHHGTLLLFRPEDRINTIRAAVGLGRQVTAYVSSSQDLHVVFNCGAGCMVHDGSSPMLGLPLGLGPSLGFYLMSQAGGQRPSFVLAPSESPGATAGLDILANASWWEDDRWYKVVLQGDDGDQVGRVRGSAGGWVVQVLVRNVSYSVTNATSVLWTRSCYPDIGEGVGPTSTTMPITSTTHLPPTTSHYDSLADSAGAGEVLAWVLAGLALFVVVLLALALCTRMSPPPDRPIDFLPSVGVVSQRFDAPESYREAEEDSEPGSPTLTVPSVHHRLPQTVDYTTKVL